MTESESEKKGRFGLNEAEYQNLVDGVRYGVTIVLTVGVTFLVLSLVAWLFGR